MTLRVNGATPNSSGGSSSNTIAIDPSTGTITDTGAVTGSSTTSAFVASIAVGATINSKSVDVIPWPSSADVSMTLTARFAFAVSGAGHQTALLLLRFGGSVSRTISVIADENGNVTYRLDGTDIVGTTAGTPRTTTWVRLKISGDRVTMWTSSSSIFKSAAYTTTYSWLISDGATAYATLTSLELTGSQVDATATGASTVTFDNLTIAQGT